MGGATTRIPMSHRVLSPSYNSGAGDDHSGDHPAVQLSGSIFGFLEEEATVFTSPEDDGYCEIQREIEDDKDDECENPENVQEKIMFWDTQHQNLHTTLFRTTSLESKIRHITKEVIKEAEVAENVCSCSRPVSGDCQSCRMSKVCSRLHDSGYNSAICKSKWKNSLDIPSGEHTFVDVLDACKKGEARVIIELDFRGQFEMKKGSDEYNGLVRKLPNVFVGKIERLQNIIKILSSAAKRCMKEKKMHLGPWRKQWYLEAKWHRVVERKTTVALVKPLSVDGYSVRPRRAKASMLTMDLLGTIPNFYVPVVEVL